ncbi:MAG: hypothetical protein ABW328_15800 [Ilumatobacteraceae bacterium]
MLASALTIVALPAVWLVNRSESGATSSRPNVAAVGLPTEDAATSADAPVTVPADPMGEVGARYLEPAEVPAGPRDAAAIVVGTSPDVLVATARATYRSSVGWRTCAFSGVDSGSTVRVVNVDNGRSTQCTTRLRPMTEPQDELVMPPDLFAEIADLTSAPIDIEVRE